MWYVRNGGGIFVHSQIIAFYTPYVYIIRRYIEYHDSSKLKMAILHNVYQNLHISFVCNSGIHSSSQHYLSQIDDTPRSWKWQGNTIYVTQLQGKHQCVFTLFRLPTIHVVVYAFLNWCYENCYEIFPCLWQGWNIIFGQSCVLKMNQPSI